MKKETQKAVMKKNNEGPTITSRELTIEEALRLLDGPVTIPPRWQMRTAEIFRPYQDPENWAVMMEDITDPELKADLMKWVDTLRREIGEKSWAKRKGEKP